jgi:hypothetical protein
MKIIWYPGCGRDFTPVLTLLSVNRERRHIPNLPAGGEEPVLWMMDYAPDVARYFEHLEEGQSVPFGSRRESPGWDEDLRCHVGGEGQPIVVEALDVQRVRRFRLAGSGLARQKTYWLWATDFNNEPDAADGGRSNKEERHKHAVRKFRERQLPQADRLVLNEKRDQLRFLKYLEEFFDSAQARQPPWVGWDVTELLLEPRGRNVNQSDAMFRVWFSPFDSQVALEHVLGPSSVGVHTVVLVTGCGPERLGLHHYEPVFFKLLCAQLSTIPDYVLTDRETDRWVDPYPNAKVGTDVEYVNTGVEYSGWVPQDPVRLLERRQARKKVTDQEIE